MNLAHLLTLRVCGSGLNPGAPEELITKFAFSDAPDQPGGWSMWEEKLGEGDRRTVQASGPFLLKPNAINELIVGVVWVPDVRHPGPSIAKITAADDVAQSLFDNCFNIIDGPDAPTLSTIELDQEVILVLHNDHLESNNAYLNYSETDIFAGGGEVVIPDSLKTYVFEGYKIFQLSGPNVSPQELGDIEKARLVAQVDLKNNISDLYNWDPIQNPNAILDADARIWVPELKVSGSNEGIKNTFKITKDQFSFSDPKLINHKEYYYMAVAYAHNEFLPFDSNLPNASQPRPYLEGRGNVKTYTVIPRPIVYEELNAVYGDGVKVTRIHGVGVGGNNLDMKEGMYDKILSGNFDGRIEYKDAAGPINVKVYNPLEVKNGKFQLEIIGDHSLEDCSIDNNAKWKVTHVETGREYLSDSSIDEINEQLISDFGISISLNQTNIVGSNSDSRNGAISATIEYATEDAQSWYRGVSDRLKDVPDEEIGFNRVLFDFIKTASDLPDRTAFRTDPNSRFQSLGDGEWYPFPLTSSSEQNNRRYFTPGWYDGDRQSSVRPSGNILKNMNNVDIIMTPDKSKWSRCIVVETGNQYHHSTGEMLKIKLQPSKGISGELDDNINATGMSYFPGYAIDVETGKRLNIFFGENSYYNQFFADKVNADQSRTVGDGDGLEIGDDMLYNPSDRMLQGANGFDDIVTEADYDKVFMGGHHYIYVTKQTYDGCAQLRQKYNSNFSEVSIAEMCQPGQSLLPYSDVVIPSEARVKLRVERP